MIGVLVPEEVAAYDRYLLQHGSSLLYYSSAYKNLLCELLGCEEYTLVAHDKGQIVGVLPMLYFKSKIGRVFNSLPFYGSNGGILADTPAVERALIDAYNEIAADRGTVSSTITFNPFAQQTADGILHNYSDSRIGQFTPLNYKDDPWNQLMARVDSSARRNVEKAQRQGITIEVDNSQFDWLHNVHQENIRGVGGMPKAKCFFDLVPRYFEPEKDFQIYIAKQGSNVIAALLLFYFNQVVEYFTPAIQANYRSAQPLALIVMQAMCNAAQRGFIWWNWGGTWTTQSGVYRFKKKWDAQETNYAYYTQLNNPDILKLTPDQILEAYPHFYVVPFSALHCKGNRDE